MANAPHDDGVLQLHLRDYGGPFSQHVFGVMKEKDILRFEGPFGVFFLREESTKPIVLVASGTGFAPIKSIIETAFHRNVTRPMVLYWGCRRPKDLYLNSTPEKWAREHPHFRYVPVVSEARPEDRWSGRSGFVHRAVMEDLPDLSMHQVYACGVPVMVSSTSPSSVRIPALRNALTSPSTRLSLTRTRTRSSRAACSMESKHASISASSTQR